MTLSSTSPAVDRAGTSMRAAVVDGPGAQPYIGRVPPPQRVMSEVLVRVVAAGLNPIDVKTLSGAGAAAGAAAWPLVPGCDFSGVVVEAPYESFVLRPGDEVYGVSGFPRAGGSFAELVAVPAVNLAPKPAVLSHTEAAAVPVAALTAWGAAVELVKAHEGQRVLVHAAAGGVGHLAVQIAAYFGAHVVAVCGPRDVGWVRELGAAEVVDRTAQPFEETVDPVDAVIDLRGDDADRTGPRSLDVLRPGGLLVNVPSGSWPSVCADAERAGVRATTFRMLPSTATLGVVARLITSGDLRVSVQDVHPLDEVAAACAAMAQGHGRGKRVLQIADY